jgi:23S rRNA (cytidine1920-2'-O)/16S rRNA (cytidine1409-2'-O)-methyltransferase
MLVENGWFASRQRARAAIMAGKVFVNGQRVDKPGFSVSAPDTIECKGDELAYVSRGGLKLEAALQHYCVDVSAAVCMDVGASTGGFTDCLLQNGAKRVYAIDVGYGQLAWKLRQNPRVIVMERTNARYLKADALPECVDLITIDVAFISLKIVVPAIIQLMKPNASILALIKPQFEVGRGQVGKGGVVRDPQLHEQVIQTLADYFRLQQLKPESVYPSPVPGPKGNREFFMLLRPSEHLSESNFSDIPDKG